MDGREQQASQEVDQEVGDLQMANVGGSNTPPRFVWSPELTSAFISLRSTHEDLFTKRRNSASQGYSIILQKLAESGLVEGNALTPRQLRKKWENLLKRYRKLKHAINAGLAPGYNCGLDVSYEAWPHYKDMDQILTKREPLTHMLLPEPVSNEGFEYDDDYPGSAKRFRLEAETCPIEVAETSTQTPLQEGEGPQQEPDADQQNTLKQPSCSQTKPECDSSSTVVIPRSQVLQQLLVLHERFISIYERLVVALENSTD